MPYDDTFVMVEKSQAQIKRLLERLNVVATRFTSYPAYALLEFVRQEASTERLLPYRITITPRVEDNPRSPQRELERAERQVWRVVYWWLKAKIEAVDFGLLEFEQEFLPHMLLTDGEGRSATVDEILFERMAERKPTSDDPFGGLRPALPGGK